MYIREFTDILQTVSEDLSEDADARKFLQKAKIILDKFIPETTVLYQTTSETGKLINEYRKQIQPIVTIVSPHQQGAIMDFLRGDTIKTLLQFKNGKLLIYTGQPIN